MRNNTNQCEVIIPHFKGIVNPELERKFERIFSMSQFDAFELLKKVGQIQLIPGTNFISVEDAARFYGVRAEYLAIKLRDDGFVQERMPKDVAVWSGTRLSNHLKEVGYQCTSCDKDTYTVCDGNPENCKNIRLIKKGRVKLISPRVVLFAALRLATAYHVHKGNFEKVVKVMEEAHLFDKPKKKKEKAVKPAAPEPTAIQDKETGLTEKEPIEVVEAVTEAPEAKQHAERNARQTIEMTPEMFQFVIRSIAMEAVRAAMLEVRHNH